jgi:hypothetical protein
MFEPARPMRILASLLMSTGVPVLSVTLKVTVGLFPGVVSLSFMISRLIPGSDAELLGTTCALGMEGSKSWVAFES